jgi:hypothetical protein
MQQPAAAAPQEDTSALESVLKTVSPQPGAAAAPAINSADPLAQPSPALPEKREPGSMGAAGQDFVDKLQELTLNAARSGMASPEKLYEMQGKIEQAGFDLKLKEMDIEKEKLKAWQSYLATQADKRQVTGGGDKIMSFDEFSKGNFEIGDRMAPQPTIHKTIGSGGGGSGGGGGAAGGKQTVSWENAKDVDAQIAKLRYNDLGEPMKYDEAEYRTKVVERNRHLLSHELEVMGYDFTQAQNMARKSMDVYSVSDPQNPAPITKDGVLNLANPKVMEALITLTVNGQPASTLVEYFSKTQPKK